MASDTLTLDIPPEIRIWHIYPKFGREEWHWRRHHHYLTFSSCLDFLNGAEVTRREMEATIHSLKILDPDYKLWKDSLRIGIWEDGKYLDNVYTSLYLRWKLNLLEGKGKVCWVYLFSLLNSGHHCVQCGNLKYAALDWSHKSFICDTCKKEETRHGEIFPHF